MTEHEEQLVQTIIEKLITDLARLKGLPLTRLLRIVIARHEAVQAVEEARGDRAHGDFPDEALAQAIARRIRPEAFL